MRPIYWLLVCTLYAAAQPLSDEATITRHGDSATLITEAFRPMEAVARKFGGSSEDPFYQFTGDLLDVSTVNSRLKPGTWVPKRHRLQIEFSVKADGSPADLRGLLENVVAAENKQAPFGYRLAFHSDGFTFVPTRTRDGKGRQIEITPLLDRKVTIPWATRKIFESAAMLARELSKQTGLQVACCQSVIAGFPWGMQEMNFGATDEPARDILQRLGLSRWYVRCDPEFCFIEKG